MPLPGGDWFIGRRTHQPAELGGDRRPVDRHSIGFFDPFDRAALYKQPPDRIKLRQFIMASLPHPAKKIADDILDIGRQLDLKIRFRGALESGGIAPRRHQSATDCGMSCCEVSDRGSVDAHETITSIKAGKRKLMLGGQLDHIS
jgi:hypothetical protein